jgi:hypothetical protein
MRAAEVRRLFDRYNRNNAACKALYQANDAIESQLIAACQASADGQAAISTTDAIALKDAYMKNGTFSNVAFKAAASRRFSFERVARAAKPRSKRPYKSRCDHGPRRGDAVDVDATNPTPLPAAAFDAAHTNQPA